MLSLRTSDRRHWCGNAPVSRENVKTVDSHTDAPTGPQ